MCYLIPPKTTPTWYACVQNISFIMNLIANTIRSFSPETHFISATSLPLIQSCQTHVLPETSWNYPHLVPLRTQHKFDHKFDFKTFPNTTSPPARVLFIIRTRAPPQGFQTPNTWYLLVNHNLHQGSIGILGKREDMNISFHLCNLSTWTGASIPPHMPSAILRSTPNPLGKNWLYGRQPAGNQCEKLAIARPWGAAQLHINMLTHMLTPLPAHMLTPPTSTHYHGRISCF